MPTGYRNGYKYKREILFFIKKKKKKIVSHISIQSSFRIIIAEKPSRYNFFKSRERKFLVNKKLIYRIRISFNAPMKTSLKKIQDGKEVKSKRKKKDGCCCCRQQRGVKSKMRIRFQNLLRNLVVRFLSLQTCIINY